MAEKSNRRNGRGKSGMSAADAVRQVREELPGLLGRPVETVLGVSRGEDQGWEVTVSVVELGRIPHTTDIIGAYRVNLDDDGELIGYSRKRRYHRSQADED